MGKFDSDLQQIWGQMEEWDFFNDPSNLGELIIVTVPEFNIPELGNLEIPFNFNQRQC